MISYQFVFLFLRGRVTTNEYYITKQLFRISTTITLLKEQTQQSGILMATGWLTGLKSMMMNRTEVGVKVPQSGMILVKPLSVLERNA